MAPPSSSLNARICLFLLATDNLGRHEGRMLWYRGIFSKVVHLRRRRNDWQKVR
jgi:hypothetical protein